MMSRPVSTAKPDDEAEKPPHSLAWQPPQRTLQLPVVALMFAALTATAILFTVASIQAWRAEPEAPDEDRTRSTSAPAPAANGSVLSLYRDRFRPSLLSRTSDVPDNKREFRDRVLNVVDALAAALTGAPATARNMQLLGESLGTLIRDAPLSPYQLNGESLSLRPGITYFLPGGTNSIALIGAYDLSYPGMIYVRKNGRKLAMSIGSVREFWQNGQRCRLILNEIAADFASATFSYLCSADGTPPRAAR